jgi:hypothetical protein
MELWQEIEIKTKELDVAVRNLRKTGSAFAEAERCYKILLRQEVLKLRDEGTAVTLIPLIVYGIQEVADARSRRDTAQAVYEANKESINATKLVIKILQEQLKQEWGMAGRE